MSDLFDKQEREKELRDLDAVWPGDDAITIASEFRSAYKKLHGRDAPAVTSKDGVFTVHFRHAGDQQYTAKQIKACTERCKAKAMQAVE